MNILVYGGKGWIGSQFIALLKKAKLTYHLGASRVDNIVSLQKEIKEIQPTHGTTRLESLYKVKHIKESVRDILKNYKRDTTRKQIQTTDFPNHPNTILLVTGGCGS